MMCFNELSVSVLCLVISCRLMQIKSETYELLDNSLGCYEPVYYDAEEVNRKHLLIKDSIDTLHVNVSVFNRTFSLELQRAYSSESMVDLHHKETESTADMTFIYRGQLQGYSDSIVRVAIINGTLQGTTRFQRDTNYRIMPSVVLLKKLPPFPSVIWSEKNFAWHDGSSPVGCADAKFYKHADMKRARRSVADPVDTNQLHTHRECSLKLTTDHTVWEYFMDKTKNEDLNMYEIVHLLDDLVDSANRIFSSTDFQIKGSEGQVTSMKLHFRIKALNIMTERDCSLPEKNCTRKLCDKSLSSQALLEVFTDMETGGRIDYEDSTYCDQDDYDNMWRNEPETCLSYLITARNLHDGKPVYGHANAAAPSSGTSSGVCRPLNTGYITLLREQRSPVIEALPQHLLQTVFAHEICHSLGALHDDDQNCSNFNLQKDVKDSMYQYLMSPVLSASNGRTFSACSLHSIAQTLADKSFTECLYSFEEDDATGRDGTTVQLQPASVVWSIQIRLEFVLVAAVAAAAVATIFISKYCAQRKRGKNKETFKSDGVEMVQRTPVEGSEQEVKPGLSRQQSIRKSVASLKRQLSSQGGYRALSTEEEPLTNITESSDDGDDSVFTDHVTS